MTKLLVWVFAFVLGSIGTWALSRLGFFAGFMGGLVGTAFGIWLGRKVGQHYGG